MDFVDRLLEYMNENNLKQTDIAKLSGLSRGAISNIISRNRGANDKLLQALSNNSGRSINWWLDGCEDYNNLYSLNKLILSYNTSPYFIFPRNPFDLQIPTNNIAKPCANKTVINIFLIELCFHKSHFMKCHNNLK